MRNSIEQGGQLAAIGLGWIITNITMNTVIGLITAIGGLFYACNQGYLLYKNFKKKRA